MQRLACCTLPCRPAPALGRDRCNGDEACDGAGECLAGAPPSSTTRRLHHRHVRASRCVKHRACSPLIPRLHDALRLNELSLHGADPVQTGVAPGFIDPVRISVVRGRCKEVMDSPFLGAVRLLPLRGTESAIIFADSSKHAIHKSLRTASSTRLPRAEQRWLRCDGDRPRVPC